MEEDEIRKDYEPFEGGSRVGFEQGRVGRMKVPPNELAAYNLYKTLEKYPEFTKEARSRFQAEFVDFPGIETMSLEVLSSVLTFLKNHPKPTPENFRDENISEYFVRLLPTKEISAEEKKRLIIKLKALFLKYIVAIFSFRTEREDVDEEEEIEEGIEEMEGGDVGGEEERGGERGEEDEEDIYG
jgi:hypothetical protein